MQTLDKVVYKQLKTMAKERAITVQELLRAIVVPDWHRFNEKSHWRT
jgi:predicted DNA-binding ribbon-helix-helix protein